MRLEVVGVNAPTPGVASSIRWRMRAIHSIPTTPRSLPAREPRRRRGGARDGPLPRVDHATSGAYNPSSSMPCGANRSKLPRQRRKEARVPQKTRISVAAPPLPRARQGWCSHGNPRFLRDPSLFAPLPRQFRSVCAAWHRRRRVVRTGGCVVNAGEGTITRPASAPAGFAGRETARCRWDRMNRSHAPANG